MVLTELREFLNTHPWTVVLFLIFCIVLTIVIIVGLSLLFIRIESMIQKRKHCKLRKNYPEFFKIYDDFDQAQYESMGYYMQNIQPIREKIDNLVQDNYIQAEEKNKQLYILREEYAEKYPVFESLADKVTELRETLNKMAKEIYVTDKNIKGVWDWI